MNIIFVILGLFLAAMGLWGVISTLRCKLPIDAVCVDSVAISSQWVIWGARSTATRAGFWGSM